MTRELSEIILWGVLVLFAALFAVWNVFNRRRRLLDDETKAREELRNEQLKALQRALNEALEALDSHLKSRRSMEREVSQFSANDVYLSAFGEAPDKAKLEAICRSLKSQIDALEAKLTEELHSVGMTPGEWRKEMHRRPLLAQHLGSLQAR